MIASFASVGANIALNLALMGPLGPRAFPLSASASAVVNIGILCVLLPRKIGSFPAGPLARFTGWLALASAAGAAAAWAGSAAIARFAGVSFFVQLGSVIVCGLAGFGVFFVVCRILRLTEARDFVAGFCAVPARRIHPAVARRSVE